MNCIVTMGLRLYTVTENCNGGIMDNCIVAPVQRLLPELELKSSGFTGNKYPNKNLTFSLNKMNTEVNAYGDKCWYDSNGAFHREDGPALEQINGATRWYCHGKLHRLDGPAIEPANGIKEFWIYGKQVSENEFNFFFKQNGDNDKG